MKPKGSLDEPHTLNLKCTISQFSFEKPVEVALDGSLSARFVRQVLECGGFRKWPGHEPLHPLSTQRR